MPEARPEAARRAAFDSPVLTSVITRSAAWVMSARFMVAGSRPSALGARREGAGWAQEASAHCGNMSSQARCAATRLFVMCVDTPRASLPWTPGLKLKAPGKTFGELFYLCACTWPLLKPPVAPTRQAHSTTPPIRSSPYRSYDIDRRSSAYMRAWGLRHTHAMRRARRCFRMVSSGSRGSCTPGSLQLQSRPSFWRSPRHCGDTSVRGGRTGSAEPCRGGHAAVGFGDSGRHATRVQL